MRIHTVVSGDTLRSIAEKYGTTSRELLRLNELENQNVLVVGMHLLVPGASATARKYTIRQGDTLESVARRIGLSVNSLAEWTGLTGVSTLIPGRTLYLPKPVTSKRAIEVNGYLLPGGTQSDANILRDVRALTYLSIFSYQVRADGSLVAPKDQIALQTATSLGIAPLMTITNFDGNQFNTELAHTIMANPSIKTRLQDNLVQTMNQKGFRGLNVDFEHMRPDDRELYNTFIRDLAARMHETGKSISIAMGPKTSDDPQASWMGAFDYKTLGAEVDFLMLMTYEWGWVGGPPMAVAPINQVRAVLDYATSVIPADKILMGMALYGYDWPTPYVKGKTRAAGLSNNSAQNLAVTENVPIAFDAPSASPYYRYQSGSGIHEVWFEDALSAAIKFDLVYEYGLRGISYWVLGNEFPQNWYLLEDVFTVKKM